jgi:hypothetical protein
LEKVRHALRPGGVLVVEDVDFRGHFCHPESLAFSRYVELYTKTAQRRGADPNIGPRLPGLLIEAGFEAVQINLVQLAAMADESKLMAPLTLKLWRTRRRDRLRRRKRNRRWTRIYADRFWSQPRFCRAYSAERIF